jgi:hypothetical protein
MNVPAPDLVTAPLAALAPFAPLALLGLVLGLPGAGGGAATDATVDLTTTAERTGFEQTGRYEEVERLCRGFAARYPARFRCAEMGRTPEGRAMWVLVASADGKLEPDAARAAGRPVVFVVGGIHAGEIDGKDAGFLLLRDLAEGKGPAAGALAAVTLVFVPVFNVDGHERFAPNQRPNQRGPRATGFRTTAQNLNLNRDWLKGEAPEMQAMLASIDRWDPVMLVDLHVTDGARFEHDVGVMVSPEASWSAPLAGAARGISQALVAGLARRGHLPLPFYPSFRKHEDPTTGIEVQVYPPRYSNGYLAARNRLGILVETHSWRPYPHRVRTTRTLLEELLVLASAQAGRWRAVVADADRAAAALGGQSLPLSWKTEGPPRRIDFRGYAYTRVPSDVSGGTWIRYDESKPQIWPMDVYDRFAVRLAVSLPRAGYVVPAAQAAWLAPKLAAHGVRFERLDRAVARPASAAFRADTVTFARAPFEGRFPVKITGAWRGEVRELPAGSLFVPIDQARAPLVAQLLEPTGADSLASWGFFSSAFEQKEDMEDYVAEEEARKLLAAKPGLRAELDAEMKRDPTLAGDPKRRLRFFYRRHPAWDERVNLYPVLRLDRRP